MQRMATVMWKKKKKILKKENAKQDRVSSEVWVNGSERNADFDLYTCIQARYSEQEHCTTCEALFKGNTIVYRNHKVCGGFISIIS